MTNEQKELFQQIRQHLFNLHTAWVNDLNADDHHKSNEGYIGVFLYYPNWFATEDYLNAEPEVGCEIYSYLFGPHRLHEFNSLEDAWEEVSKWEYKHQ